jgi:hypothetical protein
MGRRIKTRIQDLTIEDLRWELRLWEAFDRPTATLRRRIDSLRKWLTKRELQQLRSQVKQERQEQHRFDGHPDAPTTWCVVPDSRTEHGYCGQPKDAKVHIKPDPAVIGGTALGESLFGPPKVSGATTSRQEGQR